MCQNEASKQGCAMRRCKGSPADIFMISSLEEELPLPRGSKLLTTRWKYGIYVPVVLSADLTVVLSIALTLVLSAHLTVVLSSALTVVFSADLTVVISSALTVVFSANLTSVLHYNNSVLCPALFCLTFSCGAITLQLLCLLCPVLLRPITITPYRPPPAPCRDANYKSSSSAIIQIARLQTFCL